MSNNKQVMTKTGYQAEAISLKGSQYVTVSQRIQEGHHSDFAQRFQVLRSEPLMLCDVSLWQVEIEVNQKRFIGTASINFGGRGADQTNPIENAETSALGRALGFAGFGSVDSVASAEEVREAKRRKQAGFIQKKPEGQAALEEKKKELWALAQKMTWDLQELKDYCGLMLGKHLEQITLKDADELLSNMRQMPLAINAARGAV